MAKCLISAGCLLLVVAQVCVRCSPVDRRDQSQELDTLKDLIKVLHEQLTESEITGDTQRFDSAEDAARNLQTEEGSLVVDAPSRLPTVGAAISRLLDLSRAAKSSNCFGRRIDRIGTWSGLGCNTVKLGNVKRIFRK